MASSPTEDVRRSFKRLTVDHSSNGHAVDQCRKEPSLLWRHSITVETDRQKIATLEKRKSEEGERTPTCVAQLRQHEEAFTHRTTPSVSTFSPPTFYSQPVFPNASRSSGMRVRSCREECVQDLDDVSVNELAAYLDNYLHIPKKMSHMAELMYT